MGEAKRRGSLDDRSKAASASASASASDVSRLVAKGEAPHYCFIFDRSSRGKVLLSALQKGPADLKARVNSAAFGTWEALPHFQYMAIWGSWGYSGGLTIPTLDLENMTTMTIPKIMTRVLERGGLCTFSVATDETDPSVEQRILARIGELQPSMPGSSGQAN